MNLELKSRLWGAGSGPLLGSRVSTVRANLTPLMRLLWQSAPGLLALQIALNLVQAVIPAGGTYLNRVIFDLLAQVAKGDTAAVRPSLILVAAGLGLSVVGVLLMMASSLTERYLTEYFSLDIETLVNQKAQRLPLAFFDRTETYDQLQRARGNFGDRGVQVAGAVIRIGASVITLVSLMGLLGMVHRGLPVALLPVFALSLYLNIRWGQQRYQLTRGLTAPAREMGYLAQVLCGLDAAKELRLFGLGPYLTGKWRARAVGVRKQRLALEWRQSLARLGINAFSFGTSFAVTLWLFQGLSHAELSLGTYIAMSGAVLAAINLMPQVASSISQLYEQALFTNDLFTFLALPEESRQGQVPFPARLEQGITVEGLAFRYPGTDRVALQDVSFTIRPGERVIIVGENGAGKSTLVKCLLGLYPVTQGTIRYDGINLSDLDQEHLRSQVTAVFQDFYRYALTVRENVGFGNLALLADEEALAEAAAKSGADTVVHALPDGWDSRLGRMWEGGQELSYGQWQKLALARSLLRDAQVAILDEPTAALDPKAEAALFAQFATVTSGRTSIVISHRLGTARQADHILVLKQGRLVEEGTHEELMAVGGEYARMFRLQAQWYV